MTEGATYTRHPERSLSGVAGKTQSKDPVGYSHQVPTSGSTGDEILRLRLSGGAGEATLRMTGKAGAVIGSPRLMRGGR